MDDPTSAAAAATAAAVAATAAAKAATDASAAAIRLESKIDLVNERLKGVQDRIDFGDRQVSQQVLMVADSVSRCAESVVRLEANQQTQGQQLRTLDTHPERLHILEGKVDDLRIGWARLAGAVTAAGMLGGGVAAAIARAIGG